MTRIGWRVKSAMLRVTPSISSFTLRKSASFLPMRRARSSIGGLPGCRGCVPGEHIRPIVCERRCDLAGKPGLPDDVEAVALLDDLRRLAGRRLVTPGDHEPPRVLPDS